MLRSGHVRVETGQGDLRRKRTGLEVSTGRILKSDDFIWLVGHPLDKITSAALPTRLQAYLRFRYMKIHDENPMIALDKYRQEDTRFRKLNYLQILSTKVVDEVEVFWKKGGYALKNPVECRNEILNIHKQWIKLHKSKNDDNVGSQRMQSRQDFVQSLDKIIDFNPKNWKYLIQYTRKKETAEIDIQYMEALINGKKFIMGSHDVIHSTMVEKKHMRIEEEQKRKEAEMKRVTEYIQLHEDNSESEVEASIDENRSKTNDPDFNPPQPKKKRDDYINLRLPRSFTRSPLVTITADRTRTSNSQLALLSASFLKLAGVNSEDVTLSKETIRRHRIYNRPQEAAKIKSRYVDDVTRNGTFLAVHWDEKMLPSVTGQKFEHLAILASGGSHPEGKLLAAVSIQDGRGKTMAHKIASIAEEWSLVPSIRALVFDTTSSNTGCFTGAATCLEVLFDKKMLWCACRHHVSELALGCAWETLFGGTQGKDNTHFKSFADLWPTIENSSSPRILDIQDQNLLAEKSMTVELLRKTERYVREDHREAVQLGLLMLGEIQSKNYPWRKPGAFHHARWMSHLLYVPKMLAFSEQCGYDEDYIKKLEIFVLYTSLFYLPYWINCSLATEAPKMDIDFIQINMHIPILISESQRLAEVAEAVSEKLSRHSWYLTEEMVLLSLFSESVLSCQKEFLIKKLLSFPVPRKFILGKPKLPMIGADSILSDFVGPNSWLLFHLVGKLDTATWMAANPATEWEMNDSYQEMKVVFKTLKVVNDPAERAIKLCSDFLYMTSDEQNRQDLYQVVEDHRHRVTCRTKLELFKI